MIYGADFDRARQRFDSALLFALLDEKLAESARLLEVGAYTGAVATAAIVLEHKLRGIVGGVVLDGGPTMGMSRMMAAIEEHGLLDAPLLKRLRQAIKIRNSAVHGTTATTKDDAVFLVETIQMLIDQTRKPVRRGRRLRSR